MLPKFRGRVQHQIVAHDLLPPHCRGVRGTNINHHQDHWASLARGKILLSCNFDLHRILPRLSGPSQELERMKLIIISSLRLSYPLSGIRLMQKTFDVVSFGDGSRIIMTRSLTRTGYPRLVRPQVRRRRFADGSPRRRRSLHARPSPFIGVHRDILFKKPQFPLNVVPGLLLKEVADLGIVVNRLPCRQEMGQSIDPLDRKSPAGRRRVRTPAKKGAPSLSEEMKWTACAILGENLHTSCARTRKCEFVTGEELALACSHTSSLVNNAPFGRFQRIDSTAKNAVQAWKECNPRKSRSRLPAKGTESWEAIKLEGSGCACIHNSVCISSWLWGI